MSEDGTPAEVLQNMQTSLAKLYTRITPFSSDEEARLGQELIELMNHLDFAVSRARKLYHRKEVTK